VSALLACWCESKVVVVLLQLLLLLLLLLLKCHPHRRLPVIA
jgi:hypothetical protein